MRRQDKKKNMEKVNMLFEQRCNETEIDELYGVSGVPTLRILTRKSKFGFGKYKDYTMQELLDLRLQRHLISAYFKLTSINFVDDILEEIGIVGEFVIDKPGSNNDLFIKFLDVNGGNYKPRTRDGADKLKREPKPLSKSQLRSRNQGR